MKVSTLNLMTLGAVAVAAAAVFGLALRRPEARAPAFAPLDAIPAGAALVATVDLGRLRQSEIGALLTAGGRQLPGVGRIADVCGFDPTSAIDFIAVGVPSGGPGPTDFGLVATGSFQADRLADCASTVIARQGGRPARSQIGSFIGVRDRNRSEGGEVAIREGGPVLLGGGGYLRDMIDATEGRLPPVHRDEAHLALRRSVGEDAALVATWLPKPDWLERALGTPEAKDSPLSGIRVAAIRVDVSPGWQARAILGCELARACQDLASLLERVRDDPAPILGLPLQLRDVQITQADREVRLSLNLDAQQVARITEQFLATIDAALPPAAPSASAP
jgi:hypothetical protein